MTLRCWSCVIDISFLTPVLQWPLGVGIVLQIHPLALGSCSFSFILVQSSFSLWPKLSYIANDLLKNVIIWMSQICGFKRLPIYFIHNVHIWQISKTKTFVVIVLHSWYPSTLEMETEGSQIWGHLGNLVSSRPAWENSESQLQHTNMHCIYIWVITILVLYIILVIYN